MLPVCQVQVLDRAVFSQGEVTDLLRLEACHITLSVCGSQLHGTLRVRVLLVESNAESAHLQLL